MVMHAFMELLYSGEGSIQPKSSVKEVLNVIVQAQMMVAHVKPICPQYVP